MSQLTLLHFSWFASNIGRFFHRRRRPKKLYSLKASRCVIHIYLIPAGILVIFCKLMLLHSRGFVGLIRTKLCLVPVALYKQITLGIFSLALQCRSNNSRFDLVSAVFLYEGVSQRLTVVPALPNFCPRGHNVLQNIHLDQFPSQCRNQISLRLLE